MRSIFLSLALAIASCGGEPPSSEPASTITPSSAAASTLTVLAPRERQATPDVQPIGIAASTSTPASAISYTYSQVSPPGGGLTATNVQDGLNQCAAVGYNALTTANSYTDQQIAAEAAARQAADATEAGARQLSDMIEQDARQQGDSLTLASANAFTTQQINAASALTQAAFQQSDQDTLMSANAYTDLAVSTQGLDQAPFGSGTSSIDCRCNTTTGLCNGFCQSATDGSPTKRSDHLVAVTTVSVYDPDPVAIELCNSHTTACYDIHVPANTRVHKEFKHPLLVDNMTIFCDTTTSACSHNITYAVWGYNPLNGGARAADQTPFGHGLVPICSCDTSGHCVGLCTSETDLALHSPQMLNMTGFTLRNDDGLLIDFCNSQTSACFEVYLPPGVRVDQQFDHPVRVDSMSPICYPGGTCGGIVDYSVIGYF